MTSVLLAVLLDALVGDPTWFPHPVRVIGSYIKAFEGFVRRVAKSPKALKLAGVLLTLTTVGLAYGITYGVLVLALRVNPLLYTLLHILLMYTCLAVRCLSKEANGIYKQLTKGNIQEARRLTSMIVGRDTEELQETEVARAVVETVAENASDGVIAPLIYMMLGGAPLAMAYKAINTMDSMVGYKNEKYKDFGWCAARLDDLVNYVPARITAVLMAIASLFLGYDYKGSIKTIITDGRNHSSPNSGFPEAATAGALGIKLGGTNLYFGKPVSKPTIGEGKRELEARDIQSTIFLMVGGYILCIGFAALLSCLWR